MAWTFLCRMDNVTLTAPSKEALIQKLIDHADQAHDKTMSHDAARHVVEQEAKEAAA